MIKEGEVALTKRKPEKVGVDVSEYNSIIRASLGDKIDKTITRLRLQKKCFAKHTSNQITLKEINLSHCTAGKIVGDDVVFSGGEFMTYSVKSVSPRCIVYQVSAPDFLHLIENVSQNKSEVTATVRTEKNMKSIRE